MKNGKPSHLCLVAATMVLLGTGGTAGAALMPAPPGGALTRGPLPQKVAAAFHAVRDDRPPAKIVRGIHYVVSNENRHFLYREVLKDHGGVFIGVGTDQNYLLAGWQRPDVLVLLDFDQVIVDLHRVYKLAFLDAASPDDFIKLWEKDGTRLPALIKASSETPEMKARMQRALTIGRHSVHRRLLRVQASYKRHKVATFLDDAEQYAFVAEMFKNDRVFMVRGDLTADRSISDVAAVARTFHLPVRVLYMSNAERYFNYNKDFKASMLSLPLDDRSVVLRTSDYNRFNYQYSSQSGTNFHVWLRNDKTESAKKMLAYKQYEKPNGLAMIRVTPDKLPPIQVAVRARPGDHVLRLEARRAAPAAPAAPVAPKAIQPQRPVQPATGELAAQPLLGSILFF